MTKTIRLILVNLLLLLAACFQLKLNSHVLRSGGNLQVVRHTVNAFQNAINLEGDLIGAATGYFVTVDCRF